MLAYVRDSRGRNGKRTLRTVCTCTYTFVVVVLVEHVSVSAHVVHVGFRLVARENTKRTQSPPPNQNTRNMQTNVRTQCKSEHMYTQYVVCECALVCVHCVSSYGECVLRTIRIKTQRVLCTRAENGIVYQCNV